MLTWIIRHNPAYLVSAALIAVGARLLLVHPEDPAGDITLILATLAILQLYEWAVGAILITIHLARRSPEDRPALLLVLALFWTGPIAAVNEMIAYRPSAGIYMAAGACIIAIGEMRAVLHILKVNISRASRLTCAGCVLLIAAVAPFLRTPAGNTGESEIFLYAAWWVFAILTLGCLGALHAHQNRDKSAAPDDAQFPHSALAEALFVLVTLAATTTQLIGLNYGYFCHAAPFYASPLIIALAIVAFDAMRWIAKPHPLILGSIALLPAIAMFLSLGHFEPEFPLQAIPNVLRDPLISTALFAAAAWWFAMWRHRSRLLLHLGSAALVIAVLRITQGEVASIADFGPLAKPIIFFGVAAYLAIMAIMYRSRMEGVAALMTQFVAAFYLLNARLPSHALALLLLGGWTFLGIVHLLDRRPPLAWRLFPILFLILAPSASRDFTPFKPEIIGHTIATLILLFIVGHLWRWTRYRTVSLVISTVLAVGATVQWTSMSARPDATLLILAGFGILTTGGLISWNKEKLLDRMKPPAPPPIDPPSEVTVDIV